MPEVVNKRNVNKIRDKVHKHWKGRSKTIFFVHNMIVFEENPKDSSKELLEVINKFSKVSEYKINIQKLILFIDTSNECLENTVFKNLHFSIA